MGMLLSRLLITLNEEPLDLTDFHIAMIMLENYEILATITIEQLALLCHVSKSKISKFARYLGFLDYAELRETIPNHPHSAYSYNAINMPFLENHSFFDYVTIMQDDMTLLKNTISDSKIDELAQDLIKYSKVAAFGLMYSETAAVDLQTKLAMNNKYIYTSLNDVKQNDYIQNAKEDTLIIVFSHSGDYILKQQMMTGDIQKSAFRKTKAKVVVITNNEELVSSEMIDYAILYQTSTSLPSHSILFSLISDYLVYRYRYYLTKKPNI